MEALVRAVPMSPLKRLLLSFYLIAVVSSVTLLATWAVLNLWFHSSSHPPRTKHTHEVYRYRWASSSIRINLPTYLIYKNSVNVVREGGVKVVYKNSVDNDVLKLPWVQDLQRYVNATAYTRSPQISLVVADKTCLDLLLNWLIAALVRLEEPLHNVVVLGLDAEVCHLLSAHSITCIFTDPESFIINPQLAHFRFSKRFIGPQTRLLAGRLLNYWGYSFASYDTDAIVLRNPQSIYDAHTEAHVIGGAGQHWPDWAHAKWGFALCPGAVMIRNSTPTGEPG